MVSITSGIVWYIMFPPCWKSMAPYANFLGKVLCKSIITFLWHNHDQKNNDDSKQHYFSSNKQDTPGEIYIRSVSSRSTQARCLGPSHVCMTKENLHEGELWLFGWRHQESWKALQNEWSYSLWSVSSHPPLFFFQQPGWALFKTIYPIYKRFHIMWHHSILADGVHECICH